MQAGDQNTVFYHRYVQTRTARNAIRSLTTETGEVLTAAVNIKREAVSHFQRFLQSQDVTGVEVTGDELRGILTYRCPGGVCAQLVAPVSGREINDALFSLPNGKVSGPDSYTKEFYVAVWHVIGRDFITAIQSFFLFGFLPTVINATSLTLVPKTENSEKMKDFQAHSVLLSTVQGHLEGVS